MKNENTSKLLSYLPIFFTLLGGLFILFPLVSLNGQPITVFEFFDSSIILIQVKVLLLSILFLNLSAGIMFVFRHPVLNNLALLIYITILTTIALLPGIITLIDDTISVQHHFGNVVNILCISLSLVITLREFFIKIQFSIKEMVELAILIALAVVFDFIPKIKVGATGGSISLTMMPLFIIAFRFNTVKTFVASGIIYGLITCLFDGYGFATYPFDYLLGFGLISLTSLFRKVAFSDKLPISLQITFFAIAIFAGGIARFIGATLSSMIIYRTTFWAGVSYNATYILPSVAFSLAILLLLYGFLKGINRRFPAYD